VVIATLKLRSHVHLLVIGRQTMTTRLFVVRAEWDELARVWIATSAAEVVAERREIARLVA
jgi:hypothetical protein